MRGEGWRWGRREGMGASKSSFDLNYLAAGEVGKISIPGGQNPREVGDGAQSCYTESFWH